MITIHQGDWIEQLRNLQSESAQCCVTSPPYFGLRNYQAAGQFGLESTPAEYVAKFLLGAAEIWRVLKSDGTFWLNLGDSYANDGKWGGSSGGKHVRELHVKTAIGRAKKITGMKPKDLIGIPWRVAFALQDAGWYLRSDIIWAKPNPMPESVTDRPTRSHEYIFLLTKSAKYFYDAEAIKEPCTQSTGDRLAQDVENQSGSSRANSGAKTNGPMKAARGKQRGHSRRHDGFNDRWDAMEKAGQCAGTRNKRDVWTVATASFSEAHFATFPPALITPCILAGSRPGDTVLDPFGGSGTTGLVATELGRDAILIELNPDYCAMARQRCNVTEGLGL